MHRSVVLVLAALGVVGVVAASAGSVVGASGSAGPGQARWMIRDLGTPAGHRSEARALNAAGQVVGGYAGGGVGGEHCFEAFLWQKGALKLVHPEQCVSGGDMCVSNEALAITPGGRVLGDTDRLCWTGGYNSYWLWPPERQLDSVFGSSYPALPNSAKWRSARTCSLASGGRTVCGPYEAVYGKRVAEECGFPQHTYGVGINDRGDLVAFISDCENFDTGEILGPESYVLARPDRLLTFGPRGTATLTAIDAAGDVVGSIPVSAGGSHAFLWNRKRIVDLGTLGGRDSEATAINDQGEVVGTSTTRSGARHGFIWRGGRMTDLGAWSPIEVNARGDVLGTRTEGERLRAFLWRGGRLADLGYWYGELSLDDRGRVVGADESRHAVIWEAGRRTRLPELPGGKESSALAVDAKALGSLAGARTRKAPRAPSSGRSNRADPR